MIADEKLQATYNFAFLDEATKREIRRKTLKAVCLPGHQVPYSSPELPVARGWGTGGLHLTLSLIGPNDVLKVIDQGSDASVNACNLRKFIHLTTNCRTTFDTAEATLIQTRHRIPEEVLTEEQILVVQVPQPEVLRSVERFEAKTRQMHAEADYSKMWVSLYEAYVKFGSLMQGAGYPVRAHSRYLMTPSPIPRWDVPRLSHDRGLYLFGAGREKRIHCVPPHTLVEPLEFDDVKFRTEEFSIPCSVTGMKNAFLDELYDSNGGKTYIINDSNYLDKIKAGQAPERRLFQNPEPVAQ